MANTYYWGEFANDIAPSEDGLNNVIKVIHYRKFAKNEDETVEVSYYGAFTCNPADEASYIPYDQVTNANRIAWTEAHLEATGVDVDAYLDAMIEEKVAPKIIHNYPIPTETVESN